jgi:hypothetical protein
MADTEIDPRYAAQFQRGYDPVRDAPPVRRRPVRLEGGPPATAPRVPDPPSLVERQDVAPMSVEVGAELEQTLPTTRSRLEWALLVTGVGLIVVGAALFVASVELAARYTGWSSDFESQLYSAVTSQLPGPLLVGGVVAVIAWIAVRVATGERSSP